MRVASRVTAGLLALGVAAAALIAAVEIILAALGRAYWIAPWPTWHTWVRHHPWATTPVRLACFGSCSAAAAILGLACAPHRPLSLDADDGDNPELSTHIRRASLEDSLERVGTHLDGIAVVAVTISRRRVRVKARSNRRDTSGLEEALTAQIRTQLARCRLRQRPPVRVRVAGRTK